ncbi:deoxyribodipyrimidine photolyase [Marivivens niveibacter]|uniref:Deoxyribodipyrimidine photolyase n=1 Tax=Marivivens niveibacter TaxID=1930667 RepID=A0A251WX88_9RHOB|nr:deoxyribodipyrimidine photo-lyase [Marivivens niveibacter]OUD08738.1 deoxyribodipyrimidine photolyase [Marivivens niveibacter]
MTAIVWFKRDLRLHDHPALAFAGADAVCTYIFEPEYWTQPDTSGRQFRFLVQSVIELRDDLRARGGDLVIRVGDAVDQLAQLVRETCATRIVAHEETGNAWTYARDLRVIDWARANGVQFDEYTQCGVKRRLGGRGRWQSQRDWFVAQPLISEPAISAVNLRSDPIPNGPFDACIPQSGGRQAGLDLLDSFLTRRGRTYQRAMSSPLDGEWACSRLSPHIALGTLSIGEVVQTTARHQAGAGAGWANSYRSFQSRLAWRDHFVQKLEDEPEIETRCMNPAFEGLRDPNPERLQAWAAGETGLPFVDACMRSLYATGWLNFRMRSMVMSIASYHLWMDWRAPALHLARMFTDYEPGIHWSQVQMQSGTTGINTPRIYNPIKQGKDQDPTGAFTRRWVPELRDVPDAYLQEPWLWADAGRILGRTYPHAIVDPVLAAREARDRIWSVRRSADARHHSAAVIRKHASRKMRSPRRKPTDKNQLSFDL